MCDNSKEAIITKYTDKSRYKPEHIFGDVYVDKGGNYWTFTINGKRLSIEESLFSATRRLSPPDIKNIPPGTMNCQYLIILGDFI